MDGGTDQLLGEHIMVVVLYAGPDHWVLPPMYHNRHGAFNGQEIGTSIVHDLRRHLGIQRLLKWAYIIVDGAAVNHVARDEAENELRELYLRLGILGNQDWINLNNAINSEVLRIAHDGIRLIPHITLIPCVGHFLNNVAKTALSPWVTTPLFKLRVLYERFLGWSNNFFKKRAVQRRRSGSPAFGI